MKAINEGLRFPLELAVLVALSSWGWHAGSNTPSKLVLAIVAPVTAAVVWGLWVAPRASRRLDDPFRAVIEVLVFGAGTAGLVAMDRAGLGVILGSVAAVNLLLLFVWSQR